MLEHPDALGAMVDCDPRLTDGSDAQDLVDVLLSPPPEAQVAMRGGSLYVATLAKAERLNRGATLGLRADATYLVTGGTGGLGRGIAEWLVRRGARNLVIASRRRADGAGSPWVEGLRARGVGVTLEQVDVSDADAVAAMISRLSARGGVLRGIVHAAGILDDGVLALQSRARFAAVLAPKARGALNLHAVSTGMHLDFFVMFSSAASLLGSPGQANYAAANGILDALAHERRRLGLPAISVNWGPFADTGMNVGRAPDRSERTGIGSLDPVAALSDLDSLIASGAAQRAVLVADWQRTMAMLPNEASRAWLKEVSGATANGSSPPANWLAELRTLPPDAHATRLASLVRAELATVMRLRSAADVDPDRGLLDLGLDSLMAVEFKNRVERALDLRLETTLVFNHPTVHRLSKHLASRIGPAHAPDADAADALSSLLHRVEVLSDEQAELLLAGDK
jgi:NAD(P)-dependent dehydrogenase (short-subunit alcohol dehydrogenase family)/acyl carrier protein